MFVPKLLGKLTTWPRSVGTTILKIAYSYKAESHGRDVLIDMAGDSMEKFSRAAVPGAFMVDMFPFREACPKA